MTLLMFEGAGFGEAQAVTCSPGADNCSGMAIPVLIYATLNIEIQDKVG